MRFYEIPLNLKTEIDQFAVLVEEFKKGRIEKAKFRAFRVPFGVYEQRKDDTYMVRVRCTAGGITPEQLKTVTLLSEQYGSGFIHITTRQEVQIHDVALDNIVPVMKELLKVGLSTRGGGGNTVRNIMASWDSGIAKDEVFNVAPYAIALSSLLISESDSWVLPRKFKISFSNSDKDDAYACFNDLGFIATTQNGEKGFKVYVAGGMGIKPQVGRLLHDFIPADQIHFVTEAVKRLFDQYGNRRNKHAARLRFLWNSLGQERFVELYRQEVNKLKSNGYEPLCIIDNDNRTKWVDLDFHEVSSGDFDLWKRRFVFEQKQKGLYFIIVPIHFGKLESRNAIKIADLLNSFGENTIRFTMDQNITFRNIPEAYLGNIYRLSKRVSDLTSKPKLFGNSIACAGADTCRLGICLPRGALKAIHQKLDSSNLDLDQISDFKFNLSGCPNTCGQHMVADLGFYGKVARKGQAMYPAYNVVAGSVVGHGSARFAKLVGKISSRDLPAFVVDVLKIYLDKKDKHASFADYIDNQGAEDIRQICAKYKNVPDFAEDKNYYFDWGANEQFSLAGKGVGECSAGLFDLIDVDVNFIRKKKEELEKLEDNSKIGDTLYQITLAASRMLLITRGIEAGSENDVFKSFSEHFIRSGLIASAFQPMLDMAKSANKENLVPLRIQVFDLADTVQHLYESMDDSLRFPGEPARMEITDGYKGEAQTKETNYDVFKDLRGVVCPMNFMKTKMELSNMTARQTLKILLDDGLPIENVPRSVAEEGHEILEQKRKEDHWQVLIRKKD